MWTIINISIFFIVSLFLSFYDLKYFHIPLIPMYSGLIVSILIMIFFCRQILLNRIVGMFSMSLIFLLMRIITKGGMGYGDIQYALYCGLMSGFPDFIYASLISSVFGIVMYILIKKLERKIPFIPAMMAGVLVVDIGKILLSK